MRHFIFIVACLSLLTSAVVAAPPSGDAPLRVLTKIAPPFVMEDGAGGYTGISIDLWTRVAARLGYATEFEAATLDDMLDQVGRGEADVAIAAITMTEQREENVDFSHAYYTSGLGIATTAEDSWLGAFVEVGASLISPAFLSAVGALAMVLLISGGLVWLFERRRNPEQFGGGAKGIASGFWWSAVTMTTVGYGDKAPVTLGGRLVALVWMYTSVIMIAAFTGGIASAITLGTLSGKVQGPDDLATVRVAVPADTVAAETLAGRGVVARQTSTIEAAVDLLRAGDVDAVVHDAPILQYLIREAGDDRLRVLDVTFEPASYGVALPPGSPRREAINQALLAETNAPTWRQTIARYLGAQP